jgi:vacuolar-type H+-ATPase subunit I/STV1
MEVEQSRVSGWVGWVMFGGMMLVLLGMAHMCLGALAVFEPKMLAGTRPDDLLDVSLTVLAWAHLILGAGAVVTGVALIRGLRWARIVAIIVSLITILLSFFFASVYPVWAVVVIVLSGLVLYATAAHGREVHESYGQTYVR